MEHDECYPLLNNFEICAFAEEGSAKLMIRHASGEERKFGCVHSVTTISPQEFDEFEDNVIQEKVLENLRMVSDQSSLECDVRIFGARSYAEGLSELFKHADPSEVFQALIDTDLQTIGTDYPINSEIARFIAKNEKVYERQYLDYLGSTLKDEDGNPLCNPITASLEKFYGNSIDFYEKAIKFQCTDYVKKLNLRYQNLASLPDSIGNLQALKELDLSENKLTELPDSIANLQSLEELYLRENQLTELPDSIGNLQSLEKLLLSHNKLTELPDSISDLRALESLLLHNNKLTELPESFGNLQSLKTLYLHNNKLTEIPESFGNLQSLRWLSLTNNQLTELPESMKYSENKHIRDAYQKFEKDQML
jgi:hypothetical protein